MKVRTVSNAKIDFFAAVPKISSGKYNLPYFPERGI